MADLLRVEVADGKYTVVQDSTGKLYTLRHGDGWRDCAGDNLVLALAQEVEKLREEIATLKLSVEYCGTSTNRKMALDHSNKVLGYSNK